MRKSMLTVVLGGALLIFQSAVLGQGDALHEQGKPERVPAADN